MAMFSLAGRELETESSKIAFSFRKSGFFETNGTL